MTEESRLKMHAIQNDPIAKEKKVNIAPIDYVALRKLSEHFVKYCENADTLREIVEQARALSPLDSDLDSACKFATRIQELLVYVSAICRSSSKPSEKLIAVTPINKNKKVRITSTTVVPPKTPLSTRVVNKTPPSSNNLGKLNDITNIGRSNHPLVPGLGLLQVHDGAALSARQLC
ncbi:hypothetical protein Tco_0841429 [Tanacetum coccineum]|uniref:Uncharacterized protein n=1 Tax=Tanacetum coccineum TaxID=301880 RepID=A0ABQ5AZ40_9ASTR